MLHWSKLSVLPVALRTSRVRRILSALIYIKRWGQTRSRLLLAFEQVALVRTCGLDLGTSLIFTGLYNIASGLLFGIPMPVQPMKAIAAVGVAEPQLSIAEIMAAGIFVSVVTLLLGLTGLIGALNW